jgi:hypothetical protein
MKIGAVYCPDFLFVVLKRFPFLVVSYIWIG